MNKIVEENNLARDYNIYVFHGTDGDDSDSVGTEAIEQLKIMLNYTNRVGITVVTHTWGGGRKTSVQEYLETSKLLDSRKKLIRMSLVPEDAEEQGIINSIKELTSES